MVVRTGWVMPHPPDGPGEVGATRQCDSEQGVVRQRITPPAIL
ncbi:hypothetical protein [Micromonospora violae]